MMHTSQERFSRRALSVLYSDAYARIYPLSLFDQSSIVASSTFLSLFALVTSLSGCIVFSCLQSVMPEFVV